MKRLFRIISGLSLVVLGEGDDPTRLIEHFNLYCHENYHTAPAFVFGTLEQAMNEAFEATSIEDVRLTFYASSDRSLLYSSVVHSSSIFIEKEV